jgi:hypothetical protein
MERSESRELSSSGSLKPPPSFPRGWRGGIGGDDGARKRNMFEPSKEDISKEIIDIDVESYSV